MLFLTIMATFLVMYMKGGILMERISLGAFIIALCMLTDNAIIIIEGIKVGIEAGKEKLEVVRDVVAQNQWPLFGATAIGVIAFAAIGLSEDSTGEYCNSLFWVILISLSLSWVASVTVTPLLGYLFFKPVPAASAGERPLRGAAFFQALPPPARALALRFRWAVLVLSLGLFVAALYGFGQGTQSFFPPATRPQFMVDVFLPAGTHIRETEAFAEHVEQFIQAQPGVTHVTSFVGGGGLRFLLVYTPERENRAFVQFLVDVDDEEKIDGLHGQDPEAPGRELPERQRHRQEVPPRARDRAAAFRRASRPRPGRAARAGRPGGARSSTTTAAPCASAATGASGEGHPPRPARVPGAPQRHHPRRGGRGPGNRLRGPRRRLLP